MNKEKVLKLIAYFEGWTKRVEDSKREMVGQ